MESIDLVGVVSSDGTISLVKSSGNQLPCTNFPKLAPVLEDLGPLLQGA